MNEQQLSDSEPKPQTPGVGPDPEAQRLQLVRNPSQAPRPVAPAGAQPEQPARVVAPAQPIETEEAYDDYTSHAGSYTAPKRHTVRTVLIVLALLLVAGALVYWFVLRKESPADKQASRPAASEQQEPAKSQITTDTKHYVATNFSLEFDYPEDWTVTEATNGGKLVARSPKLQLKDGSGATQAVQAVFTIRDKQQPLPEFDGGNALAVINSETITYKQPSSVQRGTTYISFLQYASAAGGVGLDGVYITGDTGYQASQVIPKADFVPVDPIISLTFEACEGGSCKPSGQRTVSIALDTWKDTLVSGPLSDILRSLVIM